MFKRKPLSLAVASSLALATCQWMIASDAHAATASAASSSKKKQEQVTNKQPMEEVVVTGSRIRNQNVISASPITTVSAKDLAFQGTVRVEDMLATMPQVYEQQGTGQSNGATGTATLDLFNLGPSRTLVLINGKRLPPGSPLQGGYGADINQIPGALIKNVEVMTGGAGAVYGSDAVAGVVNFVMKNDFQGVQLDGLYSVYQHDNNNGRMAKINALAGFQAPTGSVTDGNINNWSLIMGGNTDDGRGNVTAYVTFRKVAAVRESSRDYSNCYIGFNGYQQMQCLGSSTVPWARISNFGVKNPQETTPGNFDFSVSGHDFVPFTKDFNFNPYNYFQRPDTRYTAGVFAHYDITDKMQVYMTVMGMDDRTVSQIAPSGDFFVTSTIPCGNAFLSAQEFQQLCGQFGLTKSDTQLAYVGRRNLEGGNRQQDLRYDTFRGVFGVRGNFNQTWRYDAYGLYSEVAMANTYYNDLSITRLKRALNAVVDPKTGNIVCQAALNGVDPSCVPWNIFQTGGVTPAQYKYLELPLYARGTTSLQVWSGYVEGNLGDYGVKLPTANQGVDLVMGADYRESALAFNPDQGFTSGDGAGQGGATLPVHGGYNVKEEFMEANVPLVQGKRFAQDVNVDLSYRHSEYSTNHSTNTYGARFAWAVNNTFKLRASYQRAIRAPNVRDLYLPQGFNLFTMSADPCGGAKPAATLAQCANSGVTKAQYGSIPNSPADQYNYLQGGNPNLSPEIADTYTFGVVFTPQMVNNLVLTADYYRIKIRDGISYLDPTFIINQCVYSNQLCNDVQRGNGGDLWIGSNVNTSGHIIATNANLSVELVKGALFSATYTLDINRWGSLSFNDSLGMTFTKDTQQTASSAPIHCKGNFDGSCGFPTPATRNSLRTTWNTPWNVQASLNWRYISPVHDLAGNINMPSVSYFDLSGAWDVNDHLTMMLGCNNILDRAPPISGMNDPYANGNVFPGMYDALGRYIFARMSLKY